MKKNCNRANRDLYDHFSAEHKWGLEINTSLKQKGLFLEKTFKFKAHTPSCTVGKMKYMDLLNFTHSSPVIMDDINPLLSEDKYVLLLPRIKNEAPTEPTVHLLNINSSAVSKDSSYIYCSRQQSFIPHRTNVWE